MIKTNIPDWASRQDRPLPRENNKQSFIPSLLASIREQLKYCIEVTFFSQFCFPFTTRIAKRLVVEYELLFLSKHVPLVRLVLLTANRTSWYFE
jgi:hypothetical protein